MTNTSNPHPGHEAELSTKHRDGEDATRKHTPLTDEILKVIDQQPTNRYEVALRLTRWLEDREETADLTGRIDELKRFMNWDKWDVLSGYSDAEGISIKQIAERLTELRHLTQRQDAERGEGDV